MRNLKMVLEYDGTRYKGWQKQQKDVLTIQGKIETVLSKMTGEEIQVIGCGRTDSGVHAENYVSNFHTNCDLTVDHMLNYLYEFLPEDIVVKSLKDTSERFHARYNAKSKTYIYRINNNKFRSVFNKKYSYHNNNKFNISAMKEAADFLIGTHDFQSFTRLKPNSKSTVRFIKYINITEDKGIIEIEINGNSFLLNMVRIIVGALLEVGRGNMKTIDIEKMLNEKKKADPNLIVPARGLCLKNIEY